MGRYRAIALIVALIAAPALAGEKSSSTPLLPGSNSKDPISIDADKLEYFDKEQKAIYTGNVIAIQGDSKLTCSVMTLFLSKSGQQPAASAAPAADAAAAGPGAGGTQVRHMDAAGPVTVVSKTQVATGDRGSYDKDENRVRLFGNVTLSDGGNVTKGDRLTYNLTTGEAVVEGGKDGGEEGSGRTHSQFIPGSNNPSDAADKAAAPASPPKKAAQAPDKSKTKKKIQAPAE